MIIECLKREGKSEIKRLEWESEGDETVHHHCTYRFKNQAESEQDKVLIPFNPRRKNVCSGEIEKNDKEKQLKVLTSRRVEVTQWRVALASLSFQVQFRSRIPLFINDKLLCTRWMFQKALDWSGDWAQMPWYSCCWQAQRNCQQNQWTRRKVGNQLGKCAEVHNQHAEQLDLHGRPSEGPLWLSLTHWNHVHSRKSLPHPLQQALRDHDRFFRFAPRVRSPLQLCPTVKTEVQLAARRRAKASPARGPEPAIKVSLRSFTEGAVLATASRVPA